MASTFSESWFQVARLKLALLPTVRIHKQVYRGEVWYVLQDACSDKYYRLRPQAYQFVCDLNTKQTVEETWLNFVERFPEDAPGQDEVIQLLSQLHHSNLLFYRSEADNEQIFNRFQKNRTKEHLSKLMAPLYLRIPLWNPNSFLNAGRKILTPLFSRFAFIIWLLVLFFGAKATIENMDQIWQQGQGLLSLDNLLWLYISTFVLKIFHEMGHAIVCKKYGGDVHTMGIMFIVFTPLPYIDASASWAMRNRWHRAMVGAAGMYVELFFAAIGAIVWASTAEGILNSLAFNIMIIGSVSSILFNGNPLLRFDAYYILSDMVDIPNLYQKANQQWLYYFDRFLLGTEKSESPALSNSEELWLSSYGFLSYFYRFFIMLAILIYVLDIWIGLALIMTVIMLFIWLIIPLKKLFSYLITSPRLKNNRARAWYVSSLCLVLLFGAFVSFPIPYAIKAPGVIQSLNNTPLYAASGGNLFELFVRSGEQVEQGQVLLELVDTELQQEWVIAQAQLEETHWLLRQAVLQSATDMAALEKRQAFFEQRIEELKLRQAQLVVRAPHHGIWIENQLSERLGASLSRGDALGRVINFELLRFVSVVTQEQAAELFKLKLAQGAIRFYSHGLGDIKTDQFQFIPFQRIILPSPVLGWDSGGPIMSKTNDQGQAIAHEPFFEVYVDLPGQYAGVDGQSGILKLALSPQPLFWQVKRFIMQLLQKRFQAQGF